MRPWMAAAMDAVLVLVFAAVGRASHDESGAVLATLAVAAPFLTGLAVGWLIVHERSGRWPLTLGRGIPVWASTLVIGVLLRAIFDHGIVWPFPIVAGAVLAVFLLGWRAIAERLTARSR